LLEADDARLLWHGGQQFPCSAPWHPSRVATLETKEIKL